VAGFKVAKVSRLPNICEFALRGGAGMMAATKAGVDAGATVKLHREPADPVLSATGPQRAGFACWGGAKELPVPPSGDERYGRNLQHLLQGCQTFVYFDLHCGRDSHRACPEQ
jgi:hypothetical protein